MNREQKEAAVEEISSALTDAEAIFAVDYRGISVPQAAELRARLADADATFRVVKNRLAKRAAESAGTEEIADLFEGPIALTFVKGDPVSAAKAIATFGREHKLLEFKGGLMEGERLEPDQFNAIARLPALEVLRGQLVGVAASPITGLARGLGTGRRARGDSEQGPRERGSPRGGGGRSGSRGAEARGAEARGARRRDFRS
jgi:large subunit ribosomal protein L10